MPMAINLKRLTSKQLDQLAAQVEEHKRDRQRVSVEALRKKILALIQAEGMTLEGVLGTGFAGRQAKAVKRPVAQKYRNPAHPAETWSGRGRQPRWYAAALKAGKSQRSLLIKP
jgi:DNA-binding protein H-NS